MRVRFVYPRFQRHAETHPELRAYVPCNEYLGPPSLGIASLAAATPPEWEIDFRDDRLEDVGLDDEVDLVAISCFTPSGTRAMALADAFRARGRQVVMGGIFPTTVPEEAAAHADAIVLGEGEGVWSEVLCDAAAKQLKPVYREREPLDLSKSSLPRIDLYVHKEGRLFSPDDYPVQLSRGCPLTCSACAIPATAGRRLRHFPLQHVLGQIDQIETRGKLASFTEDTSFFFGSGTQRRFGVLLDALAERGRPAAVSYIGVSVPMILATPDAFFARLRAAGISMFYLVGGFDPITRNAFTGKDPKSYDRAVDAIRRSRDYGIEPYTSFLVGNEDDNEGTFDRMLGWADKAKLSKAEFAIMTPYPGTPVWAQLVRQERVLTKNWSLYNDANVVFRPKHLTPEQLLSGYLYLWREFYRPRREAIREMSRNDRTIQF